MSVVISKSPKVFIANLDGRTLIISRFCPDRSKVEKLKPTIAEKKQIPNPPQ